MYAQCMPLWFRLCVNQSSLLVTTLVFLTPSCGFPKIAWKVIAEKLSVPVARDASRCRVYRLNLVRWTGVLVLCAGVDVCHGYMSDYW
ncbi:hypothetical protein B0H34DRAFT_687525 [Crassisporium funariophilum]|nr:hypothetical protein B0H34DRAFT_687525 [Crassisporium funariophilum]